MVLRRHPACKPLEYLNIGQAARSGGRPGSGAGWCPRRSAMRPCNGHDNDPRQRQPSLLGYPWQHTDRRSAPAAALAIKADISARCGVGQREAPRWGHATPRGQAPRFSGHCTLEAQGLQAGHKLKQMARHHLSCLWPAGWSPAGSLPGCLIAVAESLGTVVAGLPMAIDQRLPVGAGQREIHLLQRE